MVTMFVRHTVEDYGKWRSTYDAFDSSRTALGVTAQSVYQAAENANDLTVTHDFASLEAAKAFAGSHELHEAMGAAGVVGAPTIWFTSRI